MAEDQGHHLQHPTGHGIGKLIVGFALREAVKDADAFAQRIKTAIEAS